MLFMGQGRKFLHDTPKCQSLQLDFYIFFSRLISCVNYVVCPLCPCWLFPPASAVEGIKSVLAILSDRLSVCWYVLPLVHV